MQHDPQGMTRPERPGRDRRIDVLRGLALLTIFVDHIVDNPWAAVTLREFGLVSALDVFVLLAGVSGYLAYGERLRRGGDGVHRIAHRWRVIYLTHLLLVALTVLLAIVVDWLWPEFGALRYFRVGRIVDDPVGLLPDVLLLHFVPWRSGVLTLYLVLMLLLPVIVWTVRRVWWLPLTVGLVLLVGHTWWGWHTPWIWALEPMKWFVVYAGGVTMAAWPFLRRRPADPGPGLATWITRVAVGWVVLGLLDDAPWQAVPGLASVPSPLSVVGVSLATAAWAPLARPLALAALAWLVIRWVPRDAAWLHRPWAEPVERVGRRSLPMFVLGIMLSHVASVVGVAVDRSAVVMLAMSVVGVVILLLAAQWWPARRSASSAGDARQPGLDRRGDGAPAGVEHEVVGDTGHDHRPGPVGGGGGPDLGLGEEGIRPGADDEQGRGDPGGAR